MATGYDSGNGDDATAEVIADWYAGLVDGDRARQIADRVTTDPQAAAVVDTLRAADADLAAAAELYRPVSDTAPVPPAVRARIDQVMAGLEDSGPLGATAAPSVTRPPQRRRTAAALLVGAAAVIGIGLGVGRLSATAPVPVDDQLATVQEVGVDQAAGEGPASDPTALAAAQISPEPVSLLGTRPEGPLADPERLAACLTAAGHPADALVLGAGPGEVDGTAGTMLLLPGPQPPALHVLVVGSGCGDGEADVLLSRTIGG